MTPLPSPSASHRPGDNSGFTLVMSLILVSLIAILVVGFLSSMRVERFSADSHLQGSKANYYAQTGVDIAIARIQEATQPGKFIVTQPGQIVTTTISGTGLAAPKIYALHSGKAPSYTATDSVAVDLNQQRAPLSLSSSKNLITSAPTKLLVKWLYVHKNGVIESASDTAAPSYSASNPIVGRFAFWVDDECARVNLNTAYMRPPPVNTLSPSDPSRVNLMVFSTPGLYSLSAAILSDLEAFRTATGTKTYGHYFNSIAEARQANTNTSISALIDYEKFNLGVASQTPDLNIFGEPRIVLTTQKSLAGNAPFLDILQNANTDPGLWTNLNAASVSAVVASLSAILHRKDWPYKPGVSFADKFAPVRAQQIAVNIIEYVRARESMETFCDPIRGQASGTGSFVLNLSPASGDLQGLARGGIKITEQGFYVSPVTATPPIRYQVMCEFEVYLPKYGGVDQINLNGSSVWCQFRTGSAWGTSMWAQDMFNETSMWFFCTGSVNNAQPISSTNAVVYNGSQPDSIIKAGEYRVIKSIASTSTTNSFTFKSGYTRADLKSIASTVIISIPGHTNTHSSTEEVGRINNVMCGVDPDTVAEPNIQTIAIDDPLTSACTAGVVNAWKSTAGGANGGPTMGSAPKSPLNSLGNAPTLASSIPQQDTDASGKLTDVGIRFPAPKGTLASSTGQMLNPTGIIQSVAELGFVHTGNDLLGTSVPYRTLRLQPKNNPNTLPDWALLDMFSVPVKRSASDTPSYFTLTSDNSSRSLGGRINLNAAIVPFIDASNSALVRSKPLQAVLTSASDKLGATTSVSGTLSSTLAGVIANFTVSSPVNGNAGSRYGFDYFLSRGELAEVDQVANAGEASEELLRNTVDLFTTRSNVFRIYSIGQAIKQQPSGSITVMGEKRLETLVNTGTNSSTVKPFYSRNLKP